MSFLPIAPKSEQAFILFLRQDTAHVLVIVPAYNEAPEILEAVLTGLRAATYPVVVVDDGSTPPCAEIAARCDCRYLVHAQNAGQGAALRTGMQYAVLDENIQFVVHFDADGQHRVEDLPELLAPLQAGDCDVVLGSRFLGSHPKMPKTKWYLLQAGRIFHLLLLGMWLTDAHCGLRALNRKAFSGMHLREPRMAHASEILMEIRRLGLRWREAPVRITYSDYAIKKGQSAWKAIPIALRVLRRRVGRA